MCDAVVVDMDNHVGIYVSGLVGNDATGKVTAENFEEEARICLTNLARVMNEAGGTLSDVVQITAYVTDLAYYAPYRKIRSEVFDGTCRRARPSASPHCWSTPGWRLPPPVSL